MAKEYRYAVKCHMVIAGHGHVWPNTEENRKLDRKTSVVLSESEVKRYGDDLVKVGAVKDAAPDLDKQVTETTTK